MPRPKKGEPGYEEANERWRQTVSDNYGSPSELMSRVGKLGGAASSTGGYYKDKKRAARDGSLGGRKSLRGYTYLYDKYGFYYYEHKETGELVKIKHDQEGFRTKPPVSLGYNFGRDKKEGMDYEPLESEPHE